MRALALILCVAVVAMAEDKKAPAKPEGSWTHEAEGAVIRFTFKKDDLTIVAKIGEATCTCACTCALDKEGTLTVKLTDVKVKGDFPEVPKAEAEMTFKFTVDGKKAKLTEFKSKDLEHAKAVLEGDYESKAD